MGFKVVYVVVETDVFDNSIYGIYFTKEDAWEAIFTEAETFAYENMVSCDRFDVMGEEDEWTWEDYKWLFWDTVRAFEIQEKVLFS